ncbi:hypothetical protein Poli38472_000886 [Pythium oligandrum]|uniref:RRM domain-containing protein n=1 Tax=Pythium oligandrum TaxID=41045 RepID=A0A8K1CD42_PYTOL|nr:hypothetical protein Poli38472_000886 [Pythium oligandrum]|eukprot:TMW60844.1 hypothetical protein Poli38472_000886 [Pythium oligandrum]
MSDQAKSPSPAKGRSRSPSPRDASPRAERSRSRSPAGNGSQNGSSAPEPEAQNPGNNVYVANLSHRLSQRELEDMFGKFGRLDKCELIIDPMTRESRGFAFVTFEDVRDAEDAVKEMNGKEVEGRRLRVEIAKRRRGHEKTPGKYLGPRLASTKYGRDGRDGGREPRDRSRSRRRSRSRSRDRYSRSRYDERDRYERRGYEDRGRRRSYDRYDDRRSRR